MGLFLSFLLLATCFSFSAYANTTDVAEIGANKYDSLQQAFDSAPDKEETQINLLRDIQLSTADIATLTQGKNVILNMAGFSITTDDSFTGRPIVNRGTLKVIGNGIIDSSASVSGGFGAINNYSELIIENGTFKGNASAGGSVIRNTEGTLVIENGTFSDATCAIYNDTAATATINNGTFAGTTCSSCDKVNWSYTIRNSGEFTFNNGTVTGVQGAMSSSGGNMIINNGTFSTVECAVHKAATTFYALYVAGERGVVKADVYGGNFTSIYRQALYVGNDNDGGDKLPATANIYGGKFTSLRDGVGVVFSAAKTGNPNIEGGLFSNDISSFLTEGYKQIKTDEGYQIGPVVESVCLDHSKLALKLDDTFTLKATVSPDDFIDSVVWSSSDDKIVSVDKDGNIKGLAAGEATITVTVGGSSATCEVTVYKVEAEIPSIDPEEPVEDVTAGVNDEESSEIINDAGSKVLDDILNDKEVDLDVISQETADNIKQAISEGADIVTKIESSPIAESSLKEGEAEKIKQSIESMSTGGTTVSLGQYLDLSVILQAQKDDDKKDLGTINKLDKPITITVAIPENLKADDRVFYVVRLHGDETTILETVMNADGTCSFKTDRFSTYAFVYADKVSTELPPVDNDNPDTGDTNMTMLIVLALLSLSFTVMLVHKRNRQL